MVCENRAAELEEIISRQVVFAIIGAPRADFEIGCRQAIPDMVDSGQRPQRFLIFTSPAF
jgi:hypothetical protein